MSDDVRDFQHAFSLLGELLDHNQRAQARLIVCGGAALQAAGTVSRVTKDVDVLAQRGEIDGEILPGTPLPEHLTRFARLVASELQLPANWLNASTASLLPPLSELPPALWDDLTEQDYGERLKVSFIGRVGLIYLKTYALFNREKAHDHSDLLALQPTLTEFENALAWIQEQELATPSPAMITQIRKELRDDNQPE